MSRLRRLVFVWLATVSLLVGKDIPKRTSWLKLSENNDTGPFYLKEKHIYCGATECGAQPMTEADIESFEYYPGSEYARDKKLVYYPLMQICVRRNGCCNCACDKYVLRDVDSNNFRVLEKGYATDGVHFIFRGKKLEDIDARTARVLPGPEFFSAATDGKVIYLWAKRFNEADPETFLFIKERKEGEYILGDKSHKWLMIPPKMPTRIP